MESTKRTGRIAGGLLLLHFAFGLMVPFMLLHAPVVAKPGFLGNAATHATQLRVAVFMLFAGSAIPIAVSICSFGWFRRHSQGAALWLIVIATAGFALQAADNAALMSLLSLSERYTEAAVSGQTAAFEGLAIVAGAARRWAHYTALLLAVTWIVAFCATLFRSRAVPRALAALGVVAALLQIGSVTLRGFLGYPPEMRLAMPLAPVYVAIAIWLMVKGFADADAPKRVAAERGQLAPAAK